MIGAGGQGARGKGQRQGQGATTRGKGEGDGRGARGKGKGEGDGRGARGRRFKERVYPLPPLRKEVACLPLR